MVVLLLKFDKMQLHFDFDIIRFSKHAHTDTHSDTDTELIPLLCILGWCIELRPLWAYATEHIWHNSFALHACIDAAAHSPSCSAQLCSALLRRTANVFSYFSLYAVGQTHINCTNERNFKCKICRTFW